jgi:epoxyqueuosine reductase
VEKPNDSRIGIPIIEKAVSGYCRNNELNRIKEYDDLEIYGFPLFGVASADDEMFGALKEESVVGNHHLSPREWLPTGKSVISYFLPFSKKVRKANRTMGQPAKEWLYGRYEGEIFNNALRGYLVRWFQDKGYKSVSPALDPRFRVINIRSNWSERHVAYIAGLGTLSLSCSLITKNGSAGRLGSLIVDADIAPTLRPYKAMDDYCIHCGSCISRCPPLAITEKGKDHLVCMGYCDRTLERYRPRYGCGKCQTAVPCEDRIPRKR